jgi:hypothetical protein
MNIGKIRIDKPILDLHVHVGPEFLRRRYTIKSLAEEAQHEFFGFAAKNHFQPTTAWAAMINTNYKIPIIGSITLNRGVGGINPEAVRAALSGFKTNPQKSKRDSGRFIVWMPTIHAEAHLIYTYRKDIISEWGCEMEYQYTYAEGTGLTVLDSGDTNLLNKETLKVLELIAKEDLILATGHLSSKEVELLVKEALNIGVKRIIVTHPFFKATDMSIEKQVELSKLKGVFLEICYVNLQMDKIPINSYIQLIKIAGAENIILSTDLGQINSETVGEGWENYFKLLTKEGVSKDEFIQMAIENPHKIAIKGLV